MTPKITVYTTPVCYQCKMTKQELDKAGTPYQTVDITTDEAAAQKVKALGYMQAPVVIVQEQGKEDHHWFGFRPDKLNGYKVKGAA